MGPWPFHPENAALSLATVEPPPGKDLPDLVDPFVSLGDRGAFSRVLVAEVRGPRGTPVLRVALKLQSDEYPYLPEGAPAALTCEAVEAAWGREVALLECCGAARGGILPPVEVLSRPPGEPALLPPTLYCKRQRVYFAAVCPDCGGRLGDVRDDRLLEDRGLPRRDRSLARFLGCAGCIASGRGRLWTLVRDPRFAREVGDQADLVRAFAPLAHAEGRSFPCQECEHVPTCYPTGGAGEALRLLVPVTFYESRSIATPLLLLRYDECAVLCGGTPLGSVVERVGEPGRVALLGRLASQLNGAPRFLFGHDMSGRFGLEVLRLKLALFVQLCRATALLHRHARQPHLGLTPERAMAAVGESADGLPWLWRLGVHLLGLGNAFPRRLPVGSADDLPTPSYARPRLIDPAFAAPALRDAPLADLPGVLTLRRASDAADGRVVLEADLQAESVSLAEVTDKDTVDVSIVQGRPPLSLHLAAVAAGFDGRWLRLRSVPLTLDRATRDTLGQIVGQPLARARFTVHPCLHVPVDVLSLGRILFATLLARPGRPMAEVGRAVDDVVQRLVLAARGAREEDAAVLVEEAARLLAAEPFAKRHLFSDPEAHAEAAAAVPDELWTESLLVALRAATMVRGFSICRHGGDFDPGHPEVKAEFLLQLVETLVRRVDQALFGLPGRSREVRAALARVARELKVE